MNDTDALSVTSYRDGLPGSNVRRYAQGRS